MRSLGDNETNARLHARNSEFVLTADTGANDNGLTLANFMLRRMALVIAPQDYTFIDVSLSTTADSTDYKWKPAITFLDILSVELPNRERGDKYWAVPPVQSLLLWRMAEQESSDFPRYYRILKDAQHDSILQFAPAYRWGSKTIRVTGIWEPEALQDTNSRTAFRLESWDDVFCQLCAAYYLFKNGQAVQGKFTWDLAADQIRQLSGKDVIPSEFGIGAS